MPFFASANSAMGACLPLSAPSWPATTLPNFRAVSRFFVVYLKTIAPHAYLVDVSNEIGLELRRMEDVPSECTPNFAATPLWRPLLLAKSVLVDTLRVLTQVLVSNPFCWTTLSPASITTLQCTGCRCLGSGSGTPIPCGPGLASWCTPRSASLRGSR